MRRSYHLNGPKPAKAILGLKYRRQAASESTHTRQTYCAMASVLRVANIMNRMIETVQPIQPAEK
jgi:hypothetical protein